MNAMQYTITLPNDYDMETIKERVRLNGNKTDGFEGLLLKAYLIMNTDNRKEYAPFYLWNTHEGMNTFIFDGFYDNILKSFGWQHIHIAVPLHIDLSKDILHTAYVLVIEHDITRASHLVTPEFSLHNQAHLGKVLVYNPDKWKYVEFYFLENKPDMNDRLGDIYEVLHLSM